MPQVTIQAYASLGDILGSRNLKVFTSATTVEELVGFLAEQHGQSFRDKLMDSKAKTLKGSFRILVNGRDIESLNGLETKISEGDKILFFPPVGGG